MTPKEQRDARDQLEANIASLLVAFEKQTELVVRQIHHEREMASIGGGSKVMSVHVDADIGRLYSV